ncbi:hypothetical protein NDU88_005698 [Pleurodeles waltl]|uniref:Uncharacterized protein n=1 Tax=Pleurodeles waltl TaxID=8319 RepID=A0AAV7LNH9_PLEWA|nr:hypothetical protein NDU88_005698 [Pleurodeles waltl]
MKAPLACSTMVVTGPGVSAGSRRPDERSPAVQPVRGKEHRAEHSDGGDLVPGEVLKRRTKILARDL